MFFGEGEYNPGTPDGDALLAHELAHVVQQRGADPAVAHKKKKASVETSSALEEDADGAATGVLSKLYSGAKSVVGAIGAAGAKVKPALSSGLALQRCDNKEKDKAKKKAASINPPKPKPQGKPTVKGEPSERFDGDAAIDDVDGGKSSLKTGDKGPHVIKVQQGLVDLGMLDSGSVTGEMNDKTTAGIKKLQAKAKIPESGVLDTASMAALRDGFSEFVPYRDTAMGAGTSEAEQLKGTRSLDDEDRAAIDRAMNPSADDYVAVPDGKGGVKYVEPTFKPEIAGVKYIKTLEALLESEATRQFNSMAKGKDAKARKDPGKKHDWKRYDEIGKVAKREADVVFGDYAQGDPIAEGRVLKDRYDDQDDKIGKMSDGQKLGVAQWRIQKILNASDAVAKLRTKHGAMQSREEAIEKPIRDRVASNRRDEMLQLHKNWPGSQKAGEIFLQRWKHTGKGADEQNRLQMWGLFQTCIHEYLHLLTHKDFATYANGHPNGHTLREGMTDLFTKVAWSNVPTGAVRKDVEGPFHNPAGRVPNKNRYDATAEAERVVSIVGIKNAYAAYFNGKVELIGKKP